MSPEAIVYRSEPSRYAEHRRPRDAAAPGALMLLNEGEIAVFAGEPPPTADPDRLSPVYAQTPGGRLAVPTGLVFVRFAEGVSAADRRQELARAGYEIREIISYAPQAAWLEAREGGIAAALSGLAQLATLPEMENVEPQMLLQRALRA